MSVNLNIGFNNNLITNSSYTKFRGLTVDLRCLAITILINL